MTHVHKTPRRTVLQVAVLALVILVSSLPASDVPVTDVSAADAESHETAVGDAGLAAGASTCQLRIEGRAIQRLTLADEHEQVTAWPQPGERVSLPAGRYRVREVELTGGFCCYEFAAGPDDWVQVAVDQTPVLKLGAPLTPQVHVRRVGRLLELDYQLVDAAGRNYSQRGSGSMAPPKFTVFKDGQPLGSGSFEYG
jgi:hypothetical protein